MATAAERIQAAYDELNAALAARLAEDGKPPALENMAFDKESVRHIDQDGHMRVERTPISKSAVNPYLGEEIPNYQALGLEPGRVYQMYRDPEELAKGAPTFAGKPLLISHKPVHAEDHPQELVVGAIGDDVEFEAPFLFAPLTIWTKKAIDLIESEEQRELSCGYRYTPVMKSGTAPSGEAYDGVMTDIVGNHLAMVFAGRAGSDVFVMDQLLKAPTPPPEDEDPDMAKQPVTLSRKAAVAHGALVIALAPKLAKDAKIDLRPALAGVTAKNFTEKRDSILAGVKKAAEGKLAKDAKLDDIGMALDAVKEIEAEDDLPEPAAKDEEKGAKLKNFLKDKLSAEDMKACDAMIDEQEAMDEAEDEEKDGAEDEDPDGAEDEEEEKVDKKAMDAALKAVAKQTEERTVKRMRDIRVAEDAVFPYVGKLAIACDSAAEVYKAALDALKVDVADVHPSAYSAVLRAQPLPGAKKETASSGAPVAMDAAQVNTFHELFPGAKDNPVRRI